jgi:membrane-associated phospholipid phosphatase
MRGRTKIGLYLILAILLQASSAAALPPSTIGMAAGSFAALFGWTIPVMMRGQPGFTLLGSEVNSDFKYLGNNLVMDGEDIATSPLYIADPNSPFRSEDFYIAVAGLGAMWGGSFSLDQTMRSHLQDMSGTDAGLLEHTSYGLLSVSTAGLYGYGLYSGDTRARDMAITAGEGAGISTLLDSVLIKTVFGRLRPSQTGSHTAFFHGGRSFVSGDVTPMFALAAGLSEYFNNTWYISVPIYAVALTDGFGRMGYSAHWFSDVIGAAMLGSLTTELLVHLHQQHALEDSRWHLFAASPPSTPVDPNPIGTGIGLAYRF